MDINSASAATDVAVIGFPAVPSRKRLSFKLSTL